MNAQKRSFSLDNTKKKQRPISLSSINPLKRKGSDIDEMIKTSKERNNLRNQNIFKQHKEEAIKEIINGYFQE